LIGLKYPHRRLFEEIDWSTERVFRQTIERAAELGLDTVTLGSWYDVDDVASLRRLVDELGSPAGYAAPHTAAFLRRLAPNCEPAPLSWPSRVRPRPADTDGVRLYAQEADDIVWFVALALAQGAVYLVALG